MSNLGDGLMMAAGPLLVASQTHDPMLVAATAMSSQLPWLLLGLFAGALADRLDRRMIAVVVDLLHAIVLSGLCVVIVTGRVDIWLVIGTMFVLGTAEVFADLTISTLTPMLVEKADLGIANARVQTGLITVNQLAGPALGAVLFAVGMALPFAVQATCVALGAVLVSRIGTPPGSVRQQIDTHVRHDIIDGVRWLMGNRPVRTLALVILTFNITWAAPWSVLVLLFFFGAYAFVWGTLSNAVRMRAVPREFQGRVGSVYMICVMGGMLLGSFLGGVIAHQGGIVAPWWFAFVGSGLTLALVWRELGHIAHADEVATAAV